MIFSDSFIQLLMLFLILFYTTSIVKNKLGLGIITGLNLLIFVGIILDGQTYLSVMEYITFLMLFASILVYSAITTYRTEL